jgi:hypothetical protein
MESASLTSLPVENALPSAALITTACTSSSALISAQTAAISSTIWLLKLFIASGRFMVTVAT